MRTARLPRAVQRLLYGNAWAAADTKARRLTVQRKGALSETITSATNPLVKHCVRLRENTKYRQDCGTLLLVGSTLIEEAAGGLPLDAVVMVTKAESDAQQPPWAHLAINAERTVQVSDQALKRIAGLETVEKVDLVVEVPLPAFHNLLAPGLPRVVRVLALEGVQDPGNLGALLRTAVAFGWDAVHLLPGCCDPFNDKALRASRGAAFKLPLSRGPWPHLLKVAQAHKLKLLAAQPDAAAPCGLGATSEPPQQGGYINMAQQRASAPEGVCLVLGSEGQGLSPEALEHCTPLSIPMAPSAMESLNVGTAGGILMFLLCGPAPTLLRRLPELRPRPPSASSSSSSTAEAPTPSTSRGAPRPAGQAPAHEVRTHAAAGEAAGVGAGACGRSGDDVRASGRADASGGAWVGAATGGGNRAHRDSRRAASRDAVGPHARPSS